MAGIINYLYDPLQPVWVIHTSACTSTNVLSIETGTIIQVESTTNSIESTLTYGVRLTGQSGVIPFNEVDVFPSLAAATTEYEIRLT